MNCIPIHEHHSKRSPSLSQLSNGISILKVCAIPFSAYKVVVVVVGETLWRTANDFIAPIHSSSGSRGRTRENVI